VLQVRSAQDRFGLGVSCASGDFRFMIQGSAGWSEPVPGREFHPLKSSAFHGALSRQLSVKTMNAEPQGRMPGFVFRQKNDAAIEYGPSRASTEIAAKLKGISNAAP
jgi:hypothetical protein